MAVKQGQLTRRGFLGATTAAAAAIGLPQFIPGEALGKAEKAAPSERITFGVIGLGDRGPRHCKMGGAEGQLLAACDTWKDRRDKIAAQYKVKAYADFREVLANKEIDAIVITTPDHWHVPMAILAAKAGKDVFCEKALGMSVEQDLALRAVLKRYKTVFQYGPQRRASHKFRHLCELARNGRVGKIKEINIITPTFGACAPKKIEVKAPPKTLDYEMWMGPCPKVPYVPGRCKSRGWYSIYDHSIGWLAAWGSHVLSIAQWGYDIHKAGITEYQGTGVIPNQGLNDNLIKWDVKMKCANGVKMTLKTGTNTVEFVGEEGKIWASDRGQGSTPGTLWKDVIKPGEKRLKCADLGSDFIKCVKTRETTVGPLDDAVYSDIMSHIANIAIRLKRPVKWDPAKEVIVGDAEASKLLSREIRSPWSI